MSLGKGFYEFNFSCLEDQCRIRSFGSWHVSPRVLPLSSWMPDFNPNSIRQTHAQCWVRFHGLSREYWRPKILFEIGSGVGVPIALDEATMKRSFGHFARILIEVDLTIELREKILVEREGYAFFVEIEYERLPYFCSSCQTIGHDVSNCRKHYSVTEKPVKGVEIQKDNHKKVMQYVPKTDKKIISVDNDITNNNVITDK